MTEASPPPPVETYHRLDIIEPFPYSRGWYLRRFLWGWVQATLIRLSFRRMHGWRRFWLRRFGATIPPTAGTKPSTRVTHPWLLTLGEHTWLAEGVEIYNLGPVTIGDHTIISQNAYVCAGTHDYTRRDLPLIRPPIAIGSGVWICADAFIGPNVTVGDNAIVGARAAVMKDVPPGMIVAGNPARVVRPRPRGEDPPAAATT